MSLSRASNVIYVSVVVLMIIGIGLVYGYASSPYFGVVRIDFDVTIVAYSLGDYAVITFDGLAINFTRIMPQVGSNQATPISYSAGQLHKPLVMSLNLTLTSLTNRVVLPTTDLTFTRPGRYTVVFNYLLRDVPRGTYLVKLTYTEGVHEMNPTQFWSSKIYYYEVE